MQHSEIEDLDKAIDLLEGGLADERHIIHKIYFSKKDLVVALAECYERKLEIGAPDAIPLNQIANHIIKNLQKRGAQIHVSTVYDNLPSRYKTHTSNPSDGFDSENPNENASYILNPDTERLSMELSDLYETTAQTFRELSAKYAKPDPRIELTQDDCNKIEEGIYLCKKSLELLDEIRDGRESIPPMVQYLGELAITETTNNHAAGLFVKYFKTFGSKKIQDAESKSKDLLSSKQFKKVFSGLIAKLHPRYEPKNEHEAMEVGFSGQQCTNRNCRRWRVGYDRVRNKDGEMEDKFLCFACREEQEKKTLKLPLAKPAVTVSWESAQD